MARTLMGLSAAKELNDSLRAAVDTQRALADKVGRLCDRSSFTCVKLIHLPHDFDNIPLSGGGDEGGGCVLQRPGSGAGRAEGGCREGAELAAG